VFAPEFGAPLEVFPFFVGAGRSGTTLLRAMFDSHPDLAVPGESGFIVRLARERKRYENDNGFDVGAFTDDFVTHLRFRQWDLSKDEVREALSAGVSGYSECIRRLYHFFAAREGKPRYGDKTPTYVLHLPLLADLFPESRFVHLIRDGRDVALSHLDIEGWGPRSFDEAAVQWRRHVRQGIVDGARLGPDRYREVHYEDLIEDPESTLRELCAFVALPFDAAMLRYFERAGKVAKGAPHFQNIHRPPTKGLRDWRREMRFEDVARFEALAGDLLNSLGYPLEGKRGVPTMLLAWSRKARVQGQWLRLKALRAFKRARRGHRRDEKAA